jgi:hypothetical protein
MEINYDTLNGTIDWRQRPLRSMELLIGANGCYDKWNY